MNKREWTPIESDKRWEEEDYWDKVKPELDVLAFQWSRIHNDAEQRHFMRLSDWDYGNYDMEPEEWEAMKAGERLQNDLERVQMEHIEERLHELGARMMRPYEHWNEEEKYMEYMENRGY